MVSPFTSSQVSTSAVTHLSYSLTRVGQLGLDAVHHRDDRQEEGVPCQVADARLALQGVQEVFDPLVPVYDVSPRAVYHLRTNSSMLASSNGRIVWWTKSRLSSGASL